MLSSAVCDASRADGRSTGLGLDMPFYLVRKNLFGIHFLSRLTGKSRLKVEPIFSSLLTSI